MKSKDEIRREYVKLGYLLPMIQDAGIRERTEARMAVLEWVLGDEPFNIEEYED